MDQMTKKNWNLNGLHLPASIHICLTLRHTEPGVAERFIKDLQESVEIVKNNPQQTGGLAPIYGMAAQIPDLSIVDELMDGYIDMLYSIDK
jgi:hypothetical protein